MTSFLTNLVAKKTEVFTKEYWQKYFVENYGKQETVAIQNADEAFFKLLEFGEHGFIAGVILTKPEAFCRPARIKTFLTGESIEKHKDGDRIVSTPHQYTPAPRQEAERVCAAVAAVLMDRLEVLGRSHLDVQRIFWILDPTKEGYKQETAEVAGNLQNTMHGLLNIAEGLGDTEGFKALAELFHKMFGNLPTGVYLRVKEVLYPAPPPSVPRYQPIVVDGKGSEQRRKKGTRKSGEHSENEATEEDIREFHRKKETEAKRVKHMLADELVPVLQGQ